MYDKGNPATARGAKRRAIPNCPGFALSVKKKAIVEGTQAITIIIKKIKLTMFGLLVIIFGILLCAFVGFMYLVYYKCRGEYKILSLIARGAIAAFYLNYLKIACTAINLFVKLIPE